MNRPEEPERPPYTLVPQYGRVRDGRRGLLWVTVVCGLVVALVAGLTVWLNVAGTAQPPNLDWRPFYSAVFNLSAEPMAHYTGTSADGTESWDLDVTSGGEQLGTVTVDGQQISVMSVGGKTYLKPPASLLAGLPSGDDADDAVTGKWITGDATLAALLPQGLDTPLDLSAELWTALTASTDFPLVGAPTQRVDGIAALTVSTPDGSLHVSADAPYRVLRLTPAAAGTGDAASPSASSAGPTSAASAPGAAAAFVPRPMSAVQPVQHPVQSVGRVRQAADFLGGLGQTDVEPMSPTALDQAYGSLIDQTKTLNSALNVGVSFDFNQTGNLECSDTDCTVTENVTTSTESGQGAALSGDVAATMTATVTVDGEPGGGCDQTTTLPINGSGTMTCDDPGVAGEVAQIKAQEQETADAEQTDVDYTIDFLASVRIEALAEVQATVDQEVQAEQDEQSAADQAGQPDALCTLNSFVAGTRVLMAGGALEPIQDVAVGDEVENSAAGSAVLQRHPVTAVHVTTTDRDFVALSVAGPHGAGQLESTAAHLYYDATTSAWTEAAALKPGDRLQTLDGALATVLAARPYSAAVTTYNLTVDDLHTYYAAAGQTPVLVHNCTEPATPTARGTAGQNKKPPSLQVSEPESEDWSESARIAQMEQEVPSFALQNRTSATSTRTYVGVLNLDNGQYALASSGGQPGCDSFCAEGNAYNALGRPTNYYISPAFTVRNNADGELTAVPKDVCAACQDDYPLGAFGPDVKMHPGGRYGGE